MFISCVAIGSIFYKPGIIIEYQDSEEISNAVQNQLHKLEYGGILYSRLKGKVRLFGFNPRHPFRKELESLLDKVLQFIPDEERKKYYAPQLRPRRTGKPY